jgi:hypothetical protein
MSSQRGKIKIEVWKFDAGDCYVIHNLLNNKESFIPLDDEPESLWTETEKIVKSNSRKSHYKFLRLVANMELDACFNYKSHSKLVKTYTVTEG